MTSDLPSPEARLTALPPKLAPPEINPDRLDLDSLKVVARLKRHGYVAYLVGGCVRDLLCGARPKDYDVATNARPEEIRQVFRQSRLIGRRFRLAHVYFPGGRLVEVATFRATPVQATDEEGEPTGDLLLTDDNQFGTSEEDALRRDFTINALFYDVQEGRVIDFVGGRADLSAKLVRTIGDPEIRLREDPVRGLRAARIAAKLGFRIADETFAAMVRHAGELPRCAPARVLEEMLKLLRSGASREAFRLLDEARILRVLLPPVAEVLERGGDEAQGRMLARLGALDAMLREGQPVTDAVMLATLLSFLPLHHDPHSLAEGPGFDEEPDTSAQTPPSADKLLAQMSAGARLPRRIADRVRAILAAQKVLLRSQVRRRRGRDGITRTPHFAESLQWFEIETRASGLHADLLERWKERAAAAKKLVVERDEEAPEEPGSEALPLGDAAAPERRAAVPSSSGGEGPPAAQSGTGVEAPTAPARKRRRRGGRRHKRVAEPGEGGAGGGTAPPADEQGS